MSFIVQDVASSLTVQNLPATIQATTAAPYYPSFPYTWTITNFDSYVTYTLSSTNGSASQASGTITYTPSTVGSGGFQINSRTVNLTITALTNYLGTLTGTGTRQGYGITVDSSNNVYLSGVESAGGMLFAKYNSNAVIQWQRTLSPGGFPKIAVDSSSNVYIGGYANLGGLFDYVLAKYNTSGTIQWQRKLGSANNDLGYDIALDSSANLYIAGDQNVGSFNDVGLAKYNSSGVIQWQRKLGDLATNEQCRGVAVDSSANVYVVGSTNTTGVNSALIAKYNTSGTIQWQRRLTGTTDNQFYGAVVNASGDVFAAGYAYVGGLYGFIIAKYNASGAIQWQRRLYSGSNDYVYSIAIDSSSNIYVVGTSDASGTIDIQIAKYNTSGTIQWQRKISTASGADYAYGVSVDNSGNFYINGYSNQGGSNNFFFAKLPDDGSKTGTYSVGGVSFTYATSTLTDAATTLTDAATTLADVAGTMTDAALTNTDAAASFTSNITGI